MHFHNNVTTGWLCVGSLLAREFQPKVLVFKEKFKESVALWPCSINVPVFCVYCSGQTRDVDVW